QLDDVPSDLLRTLHQLRVGQDFVDEPDPQRLFGVERLVGQQDLHRVGVAQLADEEAGARAVAPPALRQQRKLEAGVPAAGGPGVGRGQQNVEPRSGGPAVDRRDDRLPHTRVMVTHAPVDTGLLAVHGAGERPEEALSAQVFALLLRYVGPRRQIVAATEVPLTGASQDRAADIAVLPEIAPGRLNL